jgi:hypothetical protein
MRLIATWKQTQDETTEAPYRLTWEDGTPATAADWDRADTGSQSYPDIDYERNEVSFGYEIKQAVAMPEPSMSYEEIESEYGQDARAGDPVAQYTGEEFAALDGTYQTTEVLLYVAGSDADGWIITTQDVYQDGEETTEGGVNMAGEVVYRTRQVAVNAAKKAARQRSKAVANA